MTEDKTLFSGEVTYVNSTYSTTGGPCIRLRLDSLADLQTFEGHEGKRYMVALVEIGNDEQPTKTEPYRQRERLGPLCEWAVKRCKEPTFWQFLEEETGDPVDSEASAKEMLLLWCGGIDSRKEFDTDPDAGADLKQLIMKPYSAWLQRQGVPA